MQDIEFVAEECGVEKPRAEALLRKTNGNTKEALLNYIHGA